MVAPSQTPPIRGAGDGRSGGWQQAVLADLTGVYPRARPGPQSRLIGGPSGPGLGRGHRLNGDEPPNPFVWFTVACDASEADAVVAELTTLPMIVIAGQRADVSVAVSVSYGTNPDSGQTDQIQPSPTGVDAIYVWNVGGGAGDNAGSLTSRMAGASITTS